MRLIDADAIPWTDLNDDLPTKIKVLITFADKVNRMPTIEERKTGKWIDMGDFEQCSVCKGTHLKEFQTYYGKATWIKTDFCPSCGADMRGERSGTDKDKFEQ